MYKKLHKHTLYQLSFWGETVSLRECCRATVQKKCPTSLQPSLCSSVWALYCPNQPRQGQGSLLWSMLVSFLGKRAGRRVESGSGGANEAHVCLTYFVWKSESEVAQSRPTLFDPMGCSLPGSSIQGSNPGLPHCRQMLYRLSHQGSPKLLLCVRTLIIYILQMRKLRSREINQFKVRWLLSEGVISHSTLSTAYVQNHYFTTNVSSLRQFLKILLFCRT